MNIEVIDVQPTPNPNAMKFVLNQTLSERPLSYFNSGSAPQGTLAARLFAVDGVASLLVLNDFVTVNKTPEANWKTLTPAVKAVLTQAS